MQQVMSLTTMTKDRTSCFWIFLTTASMIVLSTDAVCTMKENSGTRDGGTNVNIQPAVSQNRSLGTPHPCLRDCGTTGPMTCEYTFHVESYYTMSEVCGECPCNLADCYRENCTTADGIPRIIAVANRMLHGPLIEVCLGDRIVVDVVNDMGNGEAVTIHWHGIHQYAAPYMDGVGMVTQCPILPHTTMRYDYIADHAGTQWWHGHVGLQRRDGLYGALVVRQPDNDNIQRDLYDFDLSEHTITVIEWTHVPALSVFVHFVHAGAKGNPPSILVNGRGSYNVYVNTSGNSSTEHTTPLSVFEVEKGFRYRFRVVSAAGDDIPMKISVDGHKLLLVSCDGNDIQPREVDAFVIFGGERYDFILTASQDNGTFWMKVKGEKSVPVTENQGLAIVRYKNSDLSFPTANASLDRGGVVYQKWNTDPSEEVITVNQLRTADEVNVTGDVQRTIYLPVDFSTMVNPTYKPNFRSAQMNGRAFVFPSYPLISDYDEESEGADLCFYHDATYDEKCANEFCFCTQVIEIGLGETVEMVFIDENKAGGTGTLHPLHLHGYTFHILAQGRVGASTTKEEIIQMDAAGLIQRNLINPPRKDTVVTPTGGYTVIHFLADNPGWWILHCHIDFHLEQGMAAVVRVGNQTDLSEIPPGFPRCGAHDDEGATPDHVRGALIGLSAVSLFLLVVVVVLFVCMIRGKTPRGYEQLK